MSTPLDATSATVPAKRRANPARWWLAALLALFVISAYRVQSIHTTYMREDEEIAYRTTARDLGYAVWYQAARDVHAPLWFASFWLWQQGAGDSEFAGRLYSILLSALTLALTYQLGRRWFGAPRYGLFALAALGVSSYAHIYSLEIRPYALGMLVAALNMGLFWRWLRRGTRRTALLYGASVALMLWIHYFLAFLVMAQAVYLLVSGRLSRARLRQGIDAAALAFVLWLPWLPVFVSQIQTLKALETESGVFRGLGIGNTTEVTSLPTILNLIQLMSNGQPGLYALVLIAGGILLWRRAGLWLALAWALLVPAINLSVNLIASVYTGRYLSYVAVGLALAAGAALAALPKRIRFGALAAFAAVLLWALPSQLPAHTPYRMVFQGMSAAAQPGDVVFYTRAEESDLRTKWQINHYLSPALREAEADDVDEALAARRVWFVTGDLFHADVQAAFDAIEPTHPLQQVIGDCNREWCFIAQLLEAPPQTTPTRFGENMTFWGADVDSVSPQKIEARLWWRVAQAPDADYSISLQLLDASGALVAQADGAIAQGDQLVQTSQLEPGKIYVDRRALTPQTPLPPGEYRLALVVYRSWDNTRLTLPDGADSLVLDTLTIS